MELAASLDSGASALRPSTPRQVAAAESHSGRMPVPEVKARPGSLVSSDRNRSAPACGYVSTITADRLAAPSMLATAALPRFGTAET